jgi:hypothetical protein
MNTTILGTDPYSGIGARRRNGRQLALVSEARLLGLALLNIFAVALTGCEVHPKANLAIVESGTNLTFQFATKHVIGLGGLRIWEKHTKETLWDVGLCSYSGSNLDYGSVLRSFNTRNGAVNNAIQIFPLNGKKPRSPPPKGDFVVELTCYFDQWYGACSEDFYFSFLTDENGRVSQVRQLEHFPLKDRPPPTPYP